MEPFSRTVRKLILVAGLLAAGAALAACSSDETKGPRWRGSFTRAISTCGAGQTPFVLDPPLDAVIESAGAFAPGNEVSLFREDGCAFTGTIEDDGRLVAPLHPGCPTAATVRSTLTVEDVFAAETVIRQSSDYVDPQACDIEAWGLFTRE